MARKNSSLLKGFGYLLAAAFLYGTFGVLSRAVGLTIPIFYQNATRGLVAAIILTVIVTMQHAWKPVSIRDFRILFIRAIASAAAFLSYFYVIINVPFGTSYFLFYAGSVLFGYILGRFWFSEHLTKVKIISLAFALGGLLLVYQVNTSIVGPFYFGLALFSGVTTAVWNTIAKKISDTYEASYITLWDETLTVCMYLIASLLVHEQWSVPTFSLGWSASLTIGVLFVATGILVVKGFHYLEAGIGSIILLAEILFAIALGWLFYKETISLLTLIGGAFIIAAIVLPEVYAAKK